jgi:thioredoxin 1
MSDSQKSTAKHLTDKNFQTALNQAKKDGQPMFVDFYAEWCGPCKAAAPVVDKLAGEYQGQAMVAKVNVDECRQTAQRYGVMSIPTVIVFKNGKEVNKKVGYPGETGYRQMIDQAIKD